MRLIDADDLNARMYHDAFETDSDMQRWDSGCWIRYKMFENALKDAPTIEPKIVRCKNCKYWDTDYGAYGYCGRHGGHISTYREGYCHLAERRKGYGNNQSTKTEQERTRMYHADV